MAEKEIKLIVGLGNPGAEHQNDRHNVGYWFLDRLADEGILRAYEIDGTTIVTSAM